jgi:hypothetical protein
MATLRDRSTGLRLTHSLRVNSYRQAGVQGLHPHEIALVSRGREGERSHQALADAKFGSSWTDGCGDIGSVRQGADGLPVYGHRHQRGDRLAIDAINENQRPARRRNGTMEIGLGECG